ncbi:hypothetical protein K7X08_027359 [Anisodus acutangulus]|uniref:Uncharacterized protein n=1 Tax=Anisodus acutangulus TaxID=402998 RepID=A0A9Q1MK30_9SOLA|nr:hypothetical protein K7X08_027359 [Anisodus acutangulus]
MAAYAALTSLLGTIHLISQSNLDLQEGHKEHLELLYEKVNSLLEFLDTNSDDEPTKDLQSKVKDLAHEVEDIVESHIQREAHTMLIKMLQRVFHLPTKAHERLLKILRRAIENVVSIKEELIKQRKNNNLQVRNRSLVASSSPRLHVSALENDMVGHKIEQDCMRSQLRGHSSQLEVISIVGMGDMHLHEIPEGFADSMTLQQIELHGCIPSLVTFAELIFSIHCMNCVKSVDENSPIDCDRTFCA